MVEFGALIERLETLSGPDRDVDRLITKTLGDVSRRGIPRYAGFIGIGPFTSSVDAVVSLVRLELPTQNIRIDIGEDGQHSAFVFGLSREVGASATSTPAIALLIAALKFMSGVANG